MKLNDIYFEQFPVLETARLQLRQFTLDDAEAIWAVRSHPEVMKYMDCDPHKDVQASRDFIQTNLDTYAKKEGLFWAIINKDTGELMGDFAYWNINRRHFRGEIGYTLSAKYWGQGYMSEVMKVVFPFGFEELGLHSIEANINPSNGNSRGILQRFGFEKEAYFKENYYYNGAFLDSEIYSLLKPNYKN